VGSSVKIQFTTKITAQPGRKSTSAAVPGTNLDSRSRGKRKVSFRIVDDTSQKLTLIFPALIDPLWPVHPWVPVLNDSADALT
jgi:hypothetical protein